LLKSPGPVAGVLAPEVIEQMKHPEYRVAKEMRHPEYRQELEFLDPLMLLVIPLVLLLLTVLIIRAIGVATIV
jgi:hypothetical protein